MGPAGSSSAVCPGHMLDPAAFVCGHALAEFWKSPSVCLSFVAAHERGELVEVDDAVEFEVALCDHARDEFGRGARAEDGSQVLLRDEACVVLVEAIEGVAERLVVEEVCPEKIWCAHSSLSRHDDEWCRGLSRSRSEGLGRAGGVQYRISGSIFGSLF